jgi:hypothetical protein
MGLLEKFYITNLKHAVDALDSITALQRGVWVHTTPPNLEGAQQLARAGIEEIDNKLLRYLREEIHAEKGGLISNE